MSPFIFLSMYEIIQTMAMDVGVTLVKVLLVLLAGIIAGKLVGVIVKKILEAIKDNKSSKTSKIINLFKSIEKTVSDDGDNHPYLKPIGDRAEAIQDAFDNRQITTQGALKKIEKLIHEMVKARKEQGKTGFDKNTFAVYWTLKQEGIKNAKKHAPLINSVFMRFPNYKHNPDELRQLKAELYKLVLPFLGKDKMVSIVDELLKLKREK